MTDPLVIEAEPVSNPPTPVAAGRNRWKWPRLTDWRWLGLFVVLFGYLMYQYLAWDRETTIEFSGQMSAFRGVARDYDPKTPPPPTFVVAGPVSVCVTEADLTAIPRELQRYRDLIAARVNSKVFGEALGQQEVSAACGQGFARAFAVTPPPGGLTPVSITLNPGAEWTVSATGGTSFRIETSSPADPECACYGQIRMTDFQTDDGTENAPMLHFPLLTNTIHARLPPFGSFDRQAPSILLDLIIVPRFGAPANSPLALTKGRLEFREELPGWTGDDRRRVMLEYELRRGDYVVVTSNPDRSASKMAAPRLQWSGHLAFNVDAEKASTFDVRLISSGQALTAKVTQDETASNNNVAVMVFDRVQNDPYFVTLVLFVSLGLTILTIRNEVVKAVEGSGQNS